MLKKLHPVWLISVRELRDQSRDWRILGPLLVLTLGFPFVMNGIAYQVVSFINEYGGDIIVDRLVPFSILIIGFFPLTISLLGALESFVGEKERGTIEPLLVSPLEDWQLYTGKLLAGILPPILSSVTSIFIFLALVSKQDLNMPAFSLILQLFFLTFAHAVLMVSAAVVFSIQSTSVKAANLLASFIVVPVTFLMQAESWMLFWDDDTVMWLVVLAVTILAGLFVRLGLAHFQREYLLGREFDGLNLRWASRTFVKYFSGGAQSVRVWYRGLYHVTLKKLRAPILMLVVLAGISYAVTFQWVIAHPPTALTDGASSGATLGETLGEILGWDDSVKITAPYLFLHNLRATAVMGLLGIFSFGILAALGYLLNISLIGVVFGAASLFGYSPALLFFAGVFPHGLFELPALLFSTAAVLRIGLVLVTPQTQRTIGEVLLEALADWARVLVGLIIPLLAIAALIEAYVTPLVLCHFISTTCALLQ